MRKLLSFTLVLLAALAVLTGCAGSENQSASQPASETIELTISAAASLQDAAKEIKTLYEKENPQVNITYNFASSGTLQKQIEEGAPTDLFISAGIKQMDTLQEKGLIVEESRQNLLGNSLVLIAGEDSEIAAFEDILKPEAEKVSIGTPESVPAGRYAKEALISLDLWDKLQPKLVFAKDVRQVLTYVETGNAAAGMVYSSDAAMGENIKVVAAAPEDSHQPIVYPMAVINSSKQQQAAEDFAAYLSGEKAAAVFEKYGFKTLTD